MPKQQRERKGKEKRAKKIYAEKKRGGKDYVLAI